MVFAVCGTLAWSLAWSLNCLLTLAMLVTAAFTVTGLLCAQSGTYLSNKYVKSAFHMQRLVGYAILRPSACCEIAKCSI